MNRILRKGNVKYPLRGLLSLVVVILFFNATAQNISFGLVSKEQRRVEVPFKILHNFIVVEVRLFGTLPMNFIFDTGAEHTILFNRDIADFMSVAYDLRIPIMGADLTDPIYAMVTRGVDIEMGDLGTFRKDILVLENDQFQLSQITGEQIHGLLGGSFFGTSVVQIDYRRRKLTFHNPESFKTPSRAYYKMPLQIERNKAYVNGSAKLVDGSEVDLKLLLDTGAGLPFLLHNNTHPDLDLPTEYILGKLGYGLGGPIEGYVGRLPSLAIYELEFQNMLTSFQDLEHVGIDSQPITAWVRNGLIGNQLLQRMEIIIDYPRSTIYMNPRSRYNKRFRMDRSGLLLFAVGAELDEYIIQATYSNSPAREAGLLPGDKVIRVQGLSTKFMSLDYIARKLQKREGKMIKLVIMRDGQRHKMRFRLRELI